MNILMLNYEFPPIGGGASPVSYDIGKRLADRGNRITVVTMAYAGLPKHETVDGMEIYRVKCLRKEKMVCHPWEQATYILSAIKFVKKNLDIKTYNICYTHFIIPTGVVAWWLKKKYELPYVITSHGSDVIGHNNKRFKLLYLLLRKPWCNIVRKADFVIAPSLYLKELMESNEPNGYYKVIPNGVDTKFFVRSEVKKKYILIMCRLQETKNVQSIIRALTNVELGEWKVRILGDGPYKGILEQLVIDNKLESRVSFEGWVTNKSKQHLNILQESSIFISASKVENCPTAILEAASCGMRLLLSDIPAHRQLIQDQSVFFDFSNIKQLTKKIESMIQEKELYNQYDVRQYDWDKSIDQYEQMISVYNYL